MHESTIWPRDAAQRRTFTAQEAIRGLQRDCWKISEDHGFHDVGQTFGDKLALIHSEVSEALEDHRDGREPSDYWMYGDRPDSTLVALRLMYDTFSEETTVAAAQQACEVARNALDAADAKADKPCGIPSELADIVIRVMDVAETYGINLSAAIADKMAYNETRPYLHGRTM